MATKRTTTKKPSRGRTSTRSKPARGRVHSESSHSFDIIPGTHLDERSLPWVLNLVLVPAAGWALRQWAVTSTAERAALVAALVVGAGVLAHQVVDEATARTIHVKRRLALQILWVGLGVAGTIVLGLTYWWVMAVELTGVFLASWWATAASTQVRGQGDDHHDRDQLAEQLGIPGTTAKPVPAESSESRSVWGLLHRNATIDAVRSAAELIAARLGKPATGVRVVADPKDAGRSKLVVMDRDVLADPTPWPGPSAPGTSIGDSPLHLGRREDGTPLLMIRPGREPDENRGVGPRPNQHVLTSGVTRSGKTEGELCEVADSITRTEVAWWWSDTVKPDQTLPDFAPAIDRVATDRATTRRMVETLVKSIKPRARYLGLRGLRQWVPGCGLTYLVAHFEEFAAIAEYLGEAIEQFVRESGSVGMSLSGSLQRASSYVMTTELRAQFTGALCFGQREDADAGFILSSSTLDAGASPEKWSNREPGKCYLETSEVDPEEFAMPCRTFRLPGSVLRRHVAEWAPRIEPLDKHTRRAMGAGYEDLPSGMDYALANGWTKTAAGVLVPPSYGTETPPARETVRLAGPRWTETGTGDDDDPGTAPRDETGDEDRDDAETAARMELEAAKRETAREVDEEFMRDPELLPDMKAALATGDPGTPMDGDYEPGEDFELAAGTPGPELTYPQRVEALATILDRVTAGQEVDATAEQLVNAWYEVPGIRPGQRPALYRLLARLERAGQIEDLGRGAWRLHPAAPRWLRDHLAPDDDDTDRDDDQRPGAGSF